MGESLFPSFDLYTLGAAGVVVSQARPGCVNFFLSFLLDGISEFDRDPPSSLGHSASNVRAGQEAAPSAAGANQRAWRLRSHLAVASRLPRIPAPPGRSETALKLGSKLRDNTQTLS